MKFKPRADDFQDYTLNNLKQSGGLSLGGSGDTGPGRSLETLPYWTGGFKAPKSSFLGILRTTRSVPPEVSSDSQALAGPFGDPGAREGFSHTLRLTNRIPYCSLTRVRLVCMCPDSLRWGSAL